MSALVTASTSSSRVLQCLELCQLICGQIENDDKRTLLQLCLSCKAFMVPALGLLWYELDNLAPLVHCLPQDLYVKYVTWREDLQREVTFTCFRRSMIKSDWERFDIAASRVRILTHSDIADTAGNNMFYQFDVGIFRSLACAQQGTSKLLPQLQQLTWNVRNDDVYPYILSFLSPSLRELKVLFITGAPTSAQMRFSLLTSLVTHCPSIQSMVLDGEDGNHMLSWGSLFVRQSSAACAPIALWTDLTSLSLKNLDLGHLAKVIAELPALTTLKLLSCRIVTPQFASNVRNFPVLKDLVMHYCDMDTCSHIVKCMSSTPLVSLNLRVMGMSKKRQWAGLINTVQDGILRNTLTTVSISFSSGHHPDVLPPETIHPLLCFRQIQILDMFGYCTIDLRDIDATFIAKAWPRLRMFTMSPNRGVPTRLTPLALIPFAKHCPKLRHLSLTFNATGVDNYEDKLGDGTCNSRLQELGVNDSPIDDPACVAAFISDVFPHLKKITVSVTNGDPEGRKRKWEEVERLIPVFVSVRRQEANRKI